MFWKAIHDSAYFLNNIWELISSIELQDTEVDFLCCNTKSISVAILKTSSGVYAQQLQ